MAGASLIAFNQPPRPGFARGGRWAVASMVLLLGIARVTTAQTPPTNLRVANFQYANKVHRFTFEWDAATSAPGKPYPSYQLSRGKSCWYETLNSGDKIVGQAATWVLYPSGARLGVTVVCSCPRRVWGYAVGVTAVGTGLESLPAKIAPAAVPADHRHPTNPNAVLLDCSA